MWLDFKPANVPGDTEALGNISSPPIATETARSTPIVLSISKNTCSVKF
jgi:hypothetical protein